MADLPRGGGRDNDADAEEGAGGGGGGDGRHRRLPGLPQQHDPLGLLQPLARAAAFPQQQQQQPASLPIANNYQAMLRQQAPSAVAQQQQQQPHPGQAAAPVGYRNPFGGGSAPRAGGADDYVPNHHVAGSFAALNVASDDTDPEEHNEDTMHRASAGWSEVDPAGGIAPSARSLHSAALLNNVMYVFGGYDGSQRVNSFHAYSFAEKRWSQVRSTAVFLFSVPPLSDSAAHAASFACLGAPFCKLTASAQPARSSRFGSLC